MRYLIHAPTPASLSAETLHRSAQALTVLLERCEEVRQHGGDETHSLATDQLPRPGAPPPEWLDVREQLRAAFAALDLEAQSRRGRGLGRVDLIFRERHTSSPAFAIELFGIKLAELWCEIETLTTDGWKLHLRAGLTPAHDWQSSLTSVLPDLVAKRTHLARWRLLRELLTDESIAAVQEQAAQNLLQRLSLLGALPHAAT